MKPDTSIQYLKGIGEARANLFAKLGIKTVRDLVFHFPRGLEDRREFKAISDLSDGETVCVCGIIASEVKSYRARGRKAITRTTVSDGTSIMQLTWFNAPYISSTLKRGMEFTFYGKAVYKGHFFEMINPITEEASDYLRKTGKILPVYPSTANLSQSTIRNAQEAALSSLNCALEDILPPSICSYYGFKSVMDSLSSIHQPESFEDFEAARQRFAFEEFLVLQAGIHL